MALPEISNSTLRATARDMHERGEQGGMLMLAATFTIHATFIEKYAKNFPLLICSLFIRVSIPKRSQSMYIKNELVRRFLEQSFTVHNAWLATYREIERGFLFSLVAPVGFKYSPT